MVGYPAIVMDWYWRWLALAVRCSWHGVASHSKQQSKQKEEKQHGPWVVCLYPEIDVRKNHCKYRGRKRERQRIKGKDKAKDYL